MQEPVSHELLTHYDRFVPAESDPAKKLGYLVRNIVPLIRDLGPDDAILEVGPGRGELMELMRGRGFVNLSAHECCAAFAQDLRAKGHRVDSRQSALAYLQEQGANSFQAILLIDVLEHMSVPEALDLLRACYDVLCPGGRLVLQVPNASGLFGLTTFTADPTHLSLWNELRLRSALESRGFVKVRVFPMALPLSLSNRLREVARHVVFGFVRFLTRVCGATPVQVLTHNVICVGEKH